MSSAAIDQALARRLHQRAHLTGEFRLRSGVLSGEYFDKYLFEPDPALLQPVAAGLTAMLPDDAPRWRAWSSGVSRWPRWSPS